MLVAWLWICLLPASVCARKEDEKMEEEEKCPVAELTPAEKQATLIKKPRITNRCTYIYIYVIFIYIYIYIYMYIYIYKNGICIKKGIQFIGYRLCRRPLKKSAGDDFWRPWLTWAAPC